MQFTILTPGPSVHTIEIWRHINSDGDFEKMWRHLEKSFGVKPSERRLELVLAGLEVDLVRGKGGGTLYLKINPLKLIDATVDAAQIIPPDEKEFRKAMKELRKRLKLLKLPDDLSEYIAVRVDLCVNIRADKNSAVREWLRLQRKRLSPTCCKQKPFHDKRLSKKENRACGRDYYRLQTPHGTLVVYDKCKQADRCGVLGFDRMPKKILRIEWQLTDSAMRDVKARYQLDEVDLVLALMLDSGSLFKNNLDGLYYGGQYRKEKDVVKIIEASNYQNKVKERMLAFVKWAKKDGEGKAADKYMKEYGDKAFRRIRRRFEELNIQPVPLRKNFREDSLEPLESSLLRLLEDEG